MDTQDNTIALLKRVHQTRQFSDQPVPDDIVNAILEVARWTGSGMNAQPWDLVLVRNTDTLKQIAGDDGSIGHLGRANFAIIIAMQGEKGAIHTFDEGRLTERLMIAAAATGIGAGMMWFKDEGATAKRILGIPADRHVRTAVAFGYPAVDDDSRQKKTNARKPLSELVHQEKF